MLNYLLVPVLSLYFGLFELTIPRWHILTAFGVYYYLIFVEYIRLQSDTANQRSSVRLSRNYFLVPHLITLPQAQEPGHLKRL